MEILNIKLIKLIEYLYFFYLKVANAMYFYIYALFFYKLRGSGKLSTDSPWILLFILPGGVSGTTHPNSL
jgi:hypothetical protein